MSALYTIWLVAVHATLTSFSDAVKITRMEVPPVLSLGSLPSVILDCHYDLTDTEGLVVKWFLNSTQQVYQWIPTKKPQDLGILRGKVDLEYKASDIPSQSHRALKIISPGVSLSGNYTCAVSTFTDEDVMTKPMLIYNPGHSLQFQFVRNESIDTVHLVCSVEDVYPQPSMTIKRQSVPLPDQEMTIVSEKDGFYDALVIASAKNEGLLPKETFICELKIPEADYNVREYITYFPSPKTTTLQPNPKTNEVDAEYLETIDEESEASSGARLKTIPPTLLIDLILTYLGIIILLRE